MLSILKNSLIWTLSHVSQKIDIQDDPGKVAVPGLPKLHRFTILGGPLRGMKIVMRQVEQVAFILGNYEPRVTAIMRQHIRPGMTVYDIGANIGYFSMAFSQWVMPEGKVLSFEPDSKNLAVLRHNISTNRLHNISMFSSAVSDKDGVIQFATFGYSLVGHILHKQTPDDAQVISVPTVTLDTFVFEQNNPAPQFIKIDVEGAEEQVILGAMRILAEVRPMVIIELRHDTSERIRAIATKHRYRLEPISGDPHRVDKYGYDEFLMLPEEN